MSELTRIALPALLVAMLFLTGCNSNVITLAVPAPTLAATVTPSPTRTPRPTSTPAPTNTPKPTNTPTPTYTPTPISGAACLVGAWNVEDLSSYLAALTGGTNTQAQVLSGSGPITYRFATQGRARVTVDQLAMKLKVPVRGLSLNLTVTIDGDAAAGYTAGNSNQLEFSQVQLDGLTVSAKLGKQELFAGTPGEMADLVGFSLEPLFSAAAYDCRADTLKYTPPLQDAREVVLKRIP